MTMQLSRQRSRRRLHPAVVAARRLPVLLPRPSLRGEAPAAAAGNGQLGGKEGAKRGQSGGSQGGRVMKGQFRCQCNALRRTLPFKHDAWGQFVRPYPCV